MTRINKVYKRIVAFVIAAASAFTLMGCSNAAADSSRPMVGRTAGYILITDWSRIPSDNDQATDLWVRIIKIEGVCYVQTNSVHDWQYSLVPMNTSC